MYSGIANMAMVTEMNKKGKKDIGCKGPETIRQAANRNGNISTGAAQCPWTKEIRGGGHRMR